MKKEMVKKELIEKEYLVAYVKYEMWDSKIFLSSQLALSEIVKAESKREAYEKIKSRNTNDEIYHVISIIDMKD